jgi:hypothetical protein
MASIFVSDSFEKQSDQKEYLKTTIQKKKIYSNNVSITRNIAFTSSCIKSGYCVYFCEGSKCKHTSLVMVPKFIV